MSRRRKPKPDPTPDMEIFDPPVRWQEVSVRIRVGREWPEHVPMPDYYPRHRPMPCPECRRVLTDSGGRAARVRSIDRSIAYLRCTVCDHRWSLPVQ